MRLIQIPFFVIATVLLSASAQAEHEKNLVDRVIDTLTGEPTPVEQLEEAEEHEEEAVEKVVEAKEETDEAIVEAAEANVEVIAKAEEELEAKKELESAKAQVEKAKASIAASVKADNASNVTPEPAKKPEVAKQASAVEPKAAEKAATAPRATADTKPKAAVKKPVVEVVEEQRFRLPAGTYQFMYDDGNHAYYYGNTHIVRVARDRNYNAFEGDFRFGFGEMLFRRDGRQVTVRDNTGTYSFDGNGPILYEPSAIWAIVMDDIDSGEFNTPRGTYTVKPNGTIEFRSTVQRDDIVIR